MTTSSDDLLRRALAIAGAMNISVTEGASDGEREYTCAIRRKGLSDWELAHADDPVKALRRAVERLEDRRDLI